MRLSWFVALPTRPNASERRSCRFAYRISSSSSPYHHNHHSAVRTPSCFGCLESWFVFLNLSHTLQVTRRLHLFLFWIMFQIQIETPTLFSILQSRYFFVDTNIKYLKNATRKWPPAKLIILSCTRLIPLN